MVPVPAGDGSQPAAPFGASRLSIWLRALMRLGHSTRIRPFASMARKLALSRGAPVDVTVEEINLRCRFIDNYSERKFVFTPWRYDPEERRLILRELPPDGVFVDIGANVGLYTLTANRVLGRKGRIISFEPNPITLERLRFNLDANRKPAGERPEIVILDHGIADRDSSFTLRAHYSNLGSYSISRNSRAGLDGHDGLRDSIVIHCRPLLDVLGELGVDRIDILKIDIEGAEDAALAPYLENAPDALLARTIVIENSESLWNCDLFGMMERRGYALRFRTKMNSVFTLPGGR